MATLAAAARGEGLVRYIEQALLVREYLMRSLPPPATDEHVFTLALAHLSRNDAPTVVTPMVPQAASYWFHTGRRAYIMLAASGEARYRQGMMLLGYHLLLHRQPPPTTPIIFAPFESALWRMPAFFWPRFFYHCLISDTAATVPSLAA